MTPTSIVIYRGPSMLTGDPIVAVVTGLRIASANPKTGAMLQTYIIRSDMPPNEAVESGGDAAVCGNCPLRSEDGRYGRACYVTWWFAPMNVYRALRHTPDMAPAAAAPLLAGRHVRVGSYGDPAAVPFEVWDRALARIAGWTAYTHQWRLCDQRLRDLLMASVETEAGAVDAQALGWRTFRVRRSTEKLLANEVVCPASAEAGHRSTCEQCELCRGASRKAKSVAIMAHGRWATAI